MTTKVDKSDRWISDIVGALTDPLIVMPGGWGESLPDWIKTAITLERLNENIKHSRGEEPTGTDAEVAAYLFTASLTAPMGNDWTQIYLYVSNKVMQRSKKVEMTADIRVESISDYQQHKLDHLKRWIYDTRVRARKEKGGSERPEQKQQEEKVEKTGQLPMFQF